MEDKEKLEDRKKPSRKKGVKCKVNIDSSVATLSIKCYDEQLPCGWAVTKDAIMAINKNKYQVIAIRHDRDRDSDDFWEPAFEKPHYHIILRVLNDGRIRVKAALEMLCVVYRKEIDDSLILNHGLETVGNYANMAVYLTHETAKAILEAKEKYELDELVSNLNIDEIKQVREGYIRVSNTAKKVDIETMIELDEQAKKLGYELGNFLNWYAELPFIIRGNAKMKVIEKSYHLGVMQRVSEKKDMNRLCVFIKGEKDVGKTYAALYALKGKEVLTVEGGGTGKFDNLSASTDAIIVSDDRAPNLLNMTDNFMCQAYKRNNNNPFWCGKYFVVTSNLDFKKWLEECGIKTSESLGKIMVNTEHYNAMRSRFYVCHIENVGGVNKLICDTYSDRGKYEDQLERKEMFMEFRKKYNESLAAYVPDRKKVDYSDLNL